MTGCARAPLVREIIQAPFALLLTIQSGPFLELEILQIQFIRVYGRLNVTEVSDSQWQGRLSIANSPTIRTSVSLHAYNFKKKKELY